LHGPWGAGDLRYPQTKKHKNAMRTFLFTLALTFCFLKSPNQAEAAPAFTPLALFTEDGFKVPQPGNTFAFPKDHGSHPEFKVEWWYFTGHLWGPKNERYGFQFTFFRRAGTPVSDSKEPISERFQTREIHLLHLALLDVNSGKFIHSERMARAGWETESRVGNFDVRFGDTRAQMDDTDAQTISLSARIRNEASFNLKLRPKKPLVIFGENGISRKGDSPTAASWYLTYPRLEAAGTIVQGGVETPVKGQVWMDHEISSSQLTPDQSGWDWAGIQLDDGREIMSYRLRRKDGTTDPASSLVWVEKSGELTHKNAKEFQWEQGGKWKSPHSGAAYPLPAIIKTTDPSSGKELTLRLEPLLLDQELKSQLTGIPYWEGACQVIQDGKPVGSAYLELTGYAGSLQRALSP
jgi:predicted secreted hydrolase